MNTSQNHGLYEKVQVDTRMTDHEHNLLFEMKIIHEVTGIPGGDPSWINTRPKRQ